MPRLLESIALEKADVEPGEDHTLPPYDRIRKKLGDLAETFKTECGFDESAALAPDQPASGGKRKAESSDGAAKKPKAEGRRTHYLSYSKISQTKCYTQCVPFFSSASIALSNGVLHFACCVAL